jgi:hypothetical protein
VVLQDGTKMEYSGASCKLTTSITTINPMLFYPISSIKDPFGNTVQYSYSNANGQIKLTNIKYSPYQDIKITYKTKTNAVTKYISGASYSDDLLVETITAGSKI